MGKCKFSKEWLDRKDANGCKISVWAEKRGDDCFCSVCKRIINVGNGFTAIKQHFETPKHQSNFQKQKDTNQLQLVNDSRSDLFRLYSVKDSAYTAELIWCMKICSGNVAANFSRDIADTFKAMFPTEGAVPEGFSCNPTKVGYLITDALGPYFHSKVIKDIGSSYFSLMFDETTNNSGAKELQTAVRYWSNSSNDIVSHHLETFELGHATADVIKKHIFRALNNADLEVSKLLMIGSDAPRVNKKVFALINEEVKSLRGKSLLDCGYCSIHMVHNAFQKGLEEMGIEASDLIIAVYHYFNGWPARWEDYTNIQDKKNLPKKHFIKHVNSRWLTIQPAASRLLEQWDGIVEYFLKFIPLHQRGTMKSNNYTRIVSFLKKKTMKAEVKFVSMSSALFTEFTLLFQSHQPLIHVLYEHIKSLVLNIMARCCKSEAIKHFKENPSKDAFSGKSILPVEEFTMGEELKSLVDHLPSIQKAEFIIQMLRHYTAAGQYILDQDVVYSKVLRSFSCLKPDNVKKKVSAKRFQIIAASLPVVYDEGRLMDEWKLLQLENIKSNDRIDHYWSQLLSVKTDQLENIKSNDRIDHYWSQLLSVKTDSNNLKYPNVAVVIKAALSLSHGNAEVERGFSKSGRIMTDERASMSVRTLNARLNIIDGLKRYENKPHLVPITDELIKLARTAYNSYNMHLEEQRLKADEEKLKKLEEEKATALEEEKIKILEKSKEDISKLESELRSAKGLETIQSSTVSELLDDANEKLRDAIQKNNLAKVCVAQALLEGAMKTNNECNLKRKAIDSLGKKIEKKKDCVITNFFSKRPRLN